MKSETNEMSLEELKGVIDNLMRYHSGALAKYACRAIDAALRLEAEMEDRVEDARAVLYQEGWDAGYEDGRGELDEALEWCEAYLEDLHNPPAELVTLLRRHGRNV